MHYGIRQAQTSDFDRVVQIYSYARKFMAKNGNPHQWGTAYPSEEIVRRDIQQGNLYVVTQADTIRGVFYFSLEEDPAYKAIYDGTWCSNAPYGTIHRIASNGSGGIFSAVLNWCRERISYIRIDTHQDNHIMQGILERAGFQRCGIIYIADGSSRIAYERI